MLYVSDEGNFKNLYFASGSLHLQMGCIELDTPEHGFSYPTMVSSTPKPENTSAQLAPEKANNNSHIVGVLTFCL